MFITIPQLYMICGPGRGESLGRVRVQEPHDLAGDQHQRHQAEDEAASAVHDHRRDTQHRD